MCIKDDHARDEVTFLTGYGYDKLIMSARIVWRQRWSSPHLGLCKNWGSRIEITVRKTCHAGVLIGYDLRQCDFMKTRRTRGDKKPAYLSKNIVYVCECVCVPI